MDIDSELCDNIKACRTCGIHYVTPSKQQLKHLFQSGQEHSEIMLIRLELSQWNIEVAENDGFPQHVCNTCIHKFEQVFQLRAACINAQNEFRKFYAVANGNVPNIKIKTELPDSDQAAPAVCDFIYVDDLSDEEYDGATPFNFPHLPIKEEVIEAATIPMEEFQQPTNFVESACRVVVQTEESSSKTPELMSQIETVAENQIVAHVIECDLCEYVSSNQEEHKLHMQNVHDISDLECNICGKEFKNSTSARLKFHMKFHTLSKKIKCPLCGFVCNSKDVLREHKRTKHHKLNCKVCGKGVLAKKMKTHLRGHELKSKYSCEYCTDAFATDIERENHIWEIHANEDNTAPNSIATFQTNYTQANSENSLKEPQEENLYQEPQEHMLFKFMCAQCDQRFIYQVDLERHVNEEHHDRLTVKTQSVPFVDDTINVTCELTQNNEDINEQPNISVFEDYDNENTDHVLANNDSSINNSSLMQQDFSHPISSFDHANQIENVQNITESGTNALSYEESFNEMENNTECHLPSYVGNNLNTFACAKCSETFVAIEQLRQHHEQHLLADQQQQQELDTTPTKLKFECPFCVKSFDLKFSLNRHMKKHNYAPF